MAVIQSSGDIVGGLLARARRGASERLAKAISLSRCRSRLSAPVVSFSFDDFPQSAWRTAGPMIEAAGGRATYFVVGSHAGRTVDGVRQFDREDLAELASRGHEIGCHTYEHVRVVFERPDQIERSLARNAEFVREVAGDVVMTSFAYPFGHVNASRKIMLGRRFAVARGIHPGVNSGAVDMSQLKAVPLERRSFDETDFDAQIEACRRGPGWLVFFGHDVEDNPSPYGCTPAQLQSVLDRVTAAGIEILPIKNAAARVMFG